MGYLHVTLGWMRQWSLRRKRLKGSSFACFPQDLLP